MTCHVIFFFAGRHVMSYTLRLKLSRQSKVIYLEKKSKPLVTYMCILTISFFLFYFCGELLPAAPCLVRGEKVFTKFFAILFDH